jgi:hypothetical protein
MVLPQSMQSSTHEIIHGIIPRSYLLQQSLLRPCNTQENGQSTTTLLKTSSTSFAFSSAATVLKPKWVVSLGFEFK